MAKATTKRPRKSSARKRPVIKISNRTGRLTVAQVQRAVDSVSRGKK